MEVAGARERARHREHHPVGDGDADQRADERGEEVVGGALVEEHLDQVAAARADRARDPELAAPLGGEHDEDQEDQQDPGGDRERAERREERHERCRPPRRRSSSASCLVVVGLEPERGDGRLQQLDDLVRLAPTPPVFETNSALTRPGLPSSFWAAASGISTPAPSVPAPAVADDRLHAGRLAGGCPARIRDRVARLRAELVRAPSRSGRPRRGAGRRARRSCRPARICAEAGAAAPGRSRTASRCGSFWRLVTSCTAIGSTITGATPSTRPGGAGRRRDPVGVALREVAGGGAGLGPVCGRKRRLDPLRRDDLVGLPERGDRRRSGSSGSSCRRSRARR